jgi:hypothetical protein
VPRNRKRAPSTSPSAPEDEARRQLSDDELQSLVGIYLARALSSPVPHFAEVEALLTEAWRRGNQEVGRAAMRSLVPLRAVNGEEISGLLRSHAELQEVLIAAGKELKSRASSVFDAQLSADGAPAGARGCAAHRGDLARGGELAAGIFVGKVPCREAWPRCRSG